MTPMQRRTFKRPTREDPRMTPMQRRTCKRLQHIAKKFGLDLQSVSHDGINFFLHMGDAKDVIAWIAADGQYDGGINDEAAFRRRCSLRMRADAARLAESLG